MESSEVQQEYKVPFLASESSSSEHLPRYETVRRCSVDNVINEQHHASRPTRPLATMLFILYIPLCLAFAWMYVQSHSQTIACSTPDLLPSPARESGAISYEARKLQVDIFNNPFSGPPSPESDAAWHELIEHSTIYISREEAEQANIETLELADGSGFVVIPAVGHQIHCLKRIRHWAYRDYYFANTTVEALKEVSAHVDHCIEMFRQEIMCHGDQSFASYYYLNDSDTRSLTAQDFSLHQCVNWPKLRNWMTERSLDPTQPGLLKPPVT